MIYKRLIISFISVLLVSCANRVDTPLQHSKLVLKNNLIIQSDYSKIFFQADGPIRPADVNEYEPFCSLNTELTSTGRNPIEIEADTFRITKIDNNTPAGESFTVSAGQKEGVTYTTTFSLTSDKQSFVQSLTCQRWTVSSQKRYLSVNEIENIIGNPGNIE